MQERHSKENKNPILFYSLHYFCISVPPILLSYTSSEDGSLTPLPSWVNSHFKCSKARFCMGSSTSHVSQSGPGLHTVWESISICVSHVPQADNTITVFFPESRLLLCLAVVNYLSKCRILEQQFEMYNETQKQFLSIFHYFHNASPFNILPKIVSLCFIRRREEKVIYCKYVKIPLFSLIQFTNSVSLQTNC